MVCMRKHSPQYSPAVLFGEGVTSESKVELEEGCGVCWSLVQSSASACYPLRCEHPLPRLSP